MAVWPPHILIAWGGALGSPGLDIWTNTLKCYTSGSPTQSLSVDQQETVANALVSDLSTLVETYLASGSGDTTGLYGNSAYLDWVKVNSIGSDGKYVHPTTTVVDLETPVNGHGTSTESWRNSIVCTLRTDRQRGPAHVGRFYPAASAVGGLSSGAPYFTASYATAAATAVATLIEAINSLDPAGDGSITLTVANVSPETPTLPGGLVLAITSVEVDRVMDTQRRRTNRVPRNSESVDITT